MTRGGRPKDRSVSERRCIVTGETAPKAGLIRFAVSPDGVIVPDLLERLPGRGMWVTAERAVFDEARRGQFARGAKAPVEVPDDLGDQVERLLVRRVQDLVALARKAGEAVTGFEKVKGWLAGDRRVRVLLQASDGSERGKEKLWTPEGARWFGVLTAAELGSAFGRDRTVHAALAAGGLADRVVEEAAKLRGFRENVGGDAATLEG